MYKLLMLLMSSICLLSTVNSGTPIATGGPSLIQEGKDALLTCVVSENRHNNTVIWKKQDEVLTAGKERVSSDLRISILHDEDPKGKVETGGEVWVLLIRKLKPSDSGSYICELNSEPVLRSIHILTVKTLSAKYNNSSNNSDSSTFSIDSTMSEAGDIFLVPPHLDAPDTSLLWLPSWEETQYHDFTDCCERANITSKCMGFCYIHNILDGRTDVEPEACEKDFPQIVRCMADGRNHVPCCVEKQIPDLCQDMCRGEYTPFTDLLRTRVSCVQYTVSGLKCILQGVQQIPSSPLNVGIDEVNETRVVISWSPPEKLAHLVKNYSVNLTALHSFDEDDIDGGDYVIAGGIRKEDKNSIIRLVSRNVTSITINGLRPLTMYAITVIAVNEYGSSLPSERLRIFTHTSALATENQSGPLNKMEVPDIPDIRSCCQAHGMTYRMCLDKMCDPQKTDLATVADFMVCAPWSNITFTCLANNIDHTPCCRARGIPSACYPLCSGKVSTLDFNLFKCLRFMSEFSSCLFQGYGVLADPPTKLHIVAKTDSFIILDWNKPKRLADTISTFHVKFRHLSVGDDYFTVVKKNPPLILEGLEPNVYYEFYVVSINAYGKSEPSPRLIVRTRPAEIKSAYETKYSISTCCRASGLLPQCSPLCTYNIRVSDIEVLEPECREQMSVIARCAAGGRDHTPCCTRRGVPLTCMSLCRGVLPVHHSTALNYTHECLSYAGNILQCFEEGTGNIPGPVENLHATLVTNNSISLVWSQPDVDGNNKVNDISITTTTTTTTATATTEGSVDDKIAKAESSSLSTSGQTAINDDIYFIVQYGKVNNMTIYETVAKLGYEITTNETSIDLINLEPNTIYRIMVLTRGIYGTSLPSSMLLINTTEIKRNNNDTETTKVDQQQSTHIYGAPSPPHSLVIVAHSATWLQLSWQPPEYLHPHEKISYRVYHKSIKEDKYNVANTKVSWLRFSNLKPSSQHILYVEAVGEKAISLPSETLVAWTDPALPAFVDPPSVHPADNIPEGGAMTILCLALGNPAPTISLYVGGHLMRQDTSRHMVTVIHNVTADMEHVSCYADNGYGVPMQATRRVNICYPPKIQAAGITVAAVGDEVELRCMVDSKPVPKTFFWRDHDGRVPVIQGGNYDISIRTNESHPTVYTMALRINKLQATDVGDYFCHAENPFGSATIPVSVRIRNTRTLSHNVSECCAEMNVTMACRSACTYYVDIDAVADRPECITEFDKLMKCAADGSDHRTCCAESFVPRKCLNWCRGEAVRSKEICSLEYAKVIVGCFESHRDRLPGPPENVAVSVISDSEVMVRWDPPTKNPNVIEGYRIFFHEAAIIGSEPINSNTMTGETLETGGTLETSSPSPSSSMFNNATSMQINGSNGNFSAGISTYDIWRIDVKKTSVTIQGLKKGILYELVVKAGNVYGASVLSKPITFTLGDHHVTSATYSHAVGTISGIVASILAVLLAAAAIIFYRRHRANGKTATGVAFENPTYTRGLEQVQLPTVTSALTHTTNMNGGNLTTRTPTSTHATTTVSSNMPVPTTTTLRPSMTAKVGNSALIGASTLATQLKGTTDKTSNLDGIDAHTQCNEINPTIYEELKLGQEGLRILVAQELYRTIKEESQDSIEEAKEGLQQQLFFR